MEVVLLGKIGRREEGRGRRKEGGWKREEGSTLALRLNTVLQDRVRMSE